MTAEDVKKLWQLLDKKKSHKDFAKGRICRDTKVLIIGAGPCGLRMAIDAALLGAKVVVLEGRDDFSRNNVLHLWPFVIEDLKSIGAKLFYPKFCRGPVNHIGIKRIQIVLMKIALVLGVQVHAPVWFKEIVEPGIDEQGVERGWRAQVNPEGHPISQMDFDVIVGADGKRNTLPGFKRKCFRGKLAIAITANFQNRNTKAEAQVNEIPGLFYVFNQAFFQNLKEQAGIELENFVYYKNETHYFVMTATKKSLLQKGVIYEDLSDTQELLSRQNVNRQELVNYAREAAVLATGHKLPHTDFALNGHGEDDVAIFDFTAMHQAEHTCRAIERNGKRLLTCIVGDSLIEPFWPTGSGCARGFLGVSDAAHLIKGWAKRERTALELIAERESIFKLLSGTTPNNLDKRVNKYSINPISRYGTKLQLNAVKPEQVRHLFDNGVEYDSDDVIPPEEDLARRKSYRKIRNSRAPSIDHGIVLSWYAEKLEPYKDLIQLNDLVGSLRSGLALCAVVHLFRPDLIEIDYLTEGNGVANTQLAFNLIEQEFGIIPLISAEDLVCAQYPDRLAIVSYLTQLQDVLESEPPPQKVRRKNANTGKFKPWQVDSDSGSDEEKDQLSPLGPVYNVKQRRPSALGVLIRLGSHCAEGHEQEQHSIGDPNTLHMVDPGDGGPQQVNTLQRVQQSGIVQRRLNRGNFQLSFSGGQSPLLNRKGATKRQNAVAEDEDSDTEGEKGTWASRQDTLKEEDEPENKRVSSIPGVRLRPKPGDKNKEERLSVSMLAEKMEKAAQEQKQEKKHKQTGDMCSVCSKRLFLVERRNAHSFFFHRDCFKCAKCKIILRLDNSVPQPTGDGKVKFFCRRHGSSEARNGSHHSTLKQQDTMESIQEDLAVHHRTTTPKLRDSVDANTAYSMSMESSDGSDPEDKVDEPDMSASYRTTMSLRLLQAHEIQHEFDQVRTEEEKIERRGMEVERNLRGENNQDSPTEGTLVNEWLDVLRKKKELVNKESHIMLKMKLMELQDNYSKLTKSMQYMTLDDLEDSEEERIEDEILDTVHQIKELRAYLRAEARARRK